jgi:hypothetical protein
VARAKPTNLVGWGVNALDEPRRQGEDDCAYSKRVFKLADADLIDRPDPPGHRRRALSKVGRRQRRDA